MTGSRGPGLPLVDARYRPMYARMLGLRYLAPGGFLCFVFLEGAVALGLLLGLAELVSWWGVLVLPVTVAAMVKLNDIVAGALIRPGAAPRSVPAGRLPAAREASGEDTVRLSPAVMARAGSKRPAGGPPALLRPAAGQRATTGTVHGSRDEDRWPTPTMDASALNGPPVTRQWTEDLDDRQQRARQSAARRYE